MRFRAFLAAMPVIVLGLACGGGESEPSPGGPGTVDLILTTPYVDDGGILIAVTGASVTGVSSADYEVTYAAPSDSGVTLLLRGNLRAGVVAQLAVPDRGRLGRYRATLLQAAARGPGYQQRNLAGYEVRLNAP